MAEKWRIKMSNTTTTQASGVGFFGLLTVLFIGLKLTDVIAWSWWWVLSPLWIPFTTTMLAIAITLVLLLRTGK